MTLDSVSKTFGGKEKLQYFFSKSCRRCEELWVVILLSALVLFKCSNRYLFLLPRPRPSVWVIL